MTTAMTKIEKKEIVHAQGTSPLILLGARFNVEPAKLVEVLRGTVIKPDKNGKAASNEEVAAFCIVANQYGLNPFTREIHAFTSGEKGVVPIVGIDGWCKIVNGNPEFDGCEFDEIADDKGNPQAVTCRMHVKGRAHPVSVTERFSECKRNTGPWGQMPWRMLRHKSFMQAARYAFGLSGIYDEDEGRDIVKASPERVPVAMPRLTGPATATPPANDLAEFQETANEEPAPAAPIENSDSPEDDEKRSKVERLKLMRDKHKPKTFRTACAEHKIDPAVDLATLPLDTLQAILDTIEGTVGK